MNFRFSFCILILTHKLSLYYPQDVPANLCFYFIFYYKRKYLLGIIFMKRNINSLITDRNQTGGLKGGASRSSILFEITSVVEHFIHIIHLLKMLFHIPSAATIMSRSQ